MRKDDNRTPRAESSPGLAKGKSRTCELADGGLEKRGTKLSGQWMVATLRLLSLFLVSFFLSVSLSLGRSRGRVHRADPRRKLSESGANYFRRRIEGGRDIGPTT